MAPDLNPSFTESLGQMPPPPILTLTHSNSGGDKVINAQAVLDIHAAFNEGILSLLAQASSKAQHPISQPQAQQQPQYPGYPHQQFQPYPGGQPPSRK